MSNVDHTGEKNFPSKNVLLPNLVKQRYSKNSEFKYKLCGSFRCEMRLSKKIYILSKSLNFY